MTVLVGYPPNKRGRAVLGLAAMLARAGGEDLVVCTVSPEHWLPGLVREDTEFDTYIDDMVDGALDQARLDLPDGVAAEFVSVRARSVSSGLLRAAEEHGASLIAVGSSTAGLFGHIALSSVADRLLHSSPVPIALATRGFRGLDDVARLTVAYAGTEQGDLLVRAARDLAGRLGAAIRLAAFAVQPPPPETARFGVEAAGLVAQWTSNVQAAAGKIAEEELVVAHGVDWGHALDEVEWRDGDLLVIGSSDSGPVARVFLGSRAVKIIRHAPVPVVVVPRAAKPAAPG